MLHLDNPASFAGKGSLAGKGLARPHCGTLSESGSAKNRLIFVDDDAAYRQIVKAELEEEGFSVTDFPSGEEMLAGLEEGLDADIAVLDWSLEKISGIDLLSMLRDRGFDMPIVLLTARNTPVHEHLALQRGAADFIDKSRGTEILVPRLRLIVQNKKQSPGAGQGTFRCGHLVLKPEVGRAYWDDVDVNLTVSEFKVVHLIASQAGKYVPYRQIYDAMHYAGFMAGSGELGYRSNVRSTIKRIRSKFLECASTFDEIQNYTGFGYCWRKP